MSIREIAAGFKRTTSAPLMPMDEGARLWTIKVANKEYWRVCRWYDVDDLVQDGVMWWYVTANRYPNAEKPHLMSLYKMSFARHITDLARDMASKYEAPCDDVSELANDADAQSDMDRCIVEAPPVVRSLLQAVIDNPQELFAKRVDKKTLNERLCKLVGIEPDFDLHAAVLAYLHAR